MKPVKSMTFCGQAFDIVGNSIGQGGQGTVHKAKSTVNSQQLAIIKEMPSSADNHARIAHLIDNRLGYAIPGLSVPLALADKNRRQKLWYLAPFGKGVAVDEDKPRGFNQLLEIAILLAAVWQRLEAEQMAHGDIAPSNILIADNGDIQVIDIDNFATAEVKVPTPQMIGQHAMIAPELRQSRNHSGAAHPNIKSDRFAWGILFNILLLGRHPVDGLLGNHPVPADFDALMMSGNWPENQRPIQSGETPKNILGSALINHFQLAFSTQPDVRPDAESWRTTLIDSLLHSHSHHCGGAFVMDQALANCPWCGEKISKRHQTNLALVFTNRQTGKKVHIAIAESTFVYLGRKTLPDASSYISSKHIRVYHQGTKLYLKHVGSNPTIIQFPGENHAYTLSSHLFSTRDKAVKKAYLRLADTVFEMDIQPS